MAISWWKKTTSMNGVSFQTTTSVTVTTMRKAISPTNPNYFEYAEQSNTKHTHTKLLPKFDTREMGAPQGCTKMRTDRVSVTKNNEARFTSLPALRLTIFWTSFTRSIAAVLVSGMTIASMSSSRKTKVSKDDRLDYLSCKLLVVDEISMAGHLDLYYLDRLLSQVFGPSNSPFGSISVVLAGSSGCTMKFTILLKILYTPNFTY
jgi:hypothetical protein